MRGIGLTHALADVSGLAFDRIFMITEPDGTFITARQFPQMVRFTPSPVHDGLHLTAPDGSSAYVRFADFATQDAPTEVWGTHFTARIAPDAINKWLSGFFCADSKRICELFHVKHRNTDLLPPYPRFCYLHK